MKRNFLDGALPEQVLQLPVGEYKVRIVPTSGQPVERIVKLEAGTTVIVN